VDLQQELKQDNKAVGISFAGLFIAISFVIKDAISGPVQISLLYDIKMTFIDYIVSIIMMVVLFYIFDLILFRKFSFKAELKEPNVGAGIILAGIFIVSSTLSFLIVP